MIGNSVMAPAVVMRPMLLPENSAYQRLPSGPAVMPVGPPLAGNSAIEPAGVMRPM
jgi:hypothetical protein